MVIERITDGWTGLEIPKFDLYQNVQNVWSNPVFILMFNNNVSTYSSQLELIRILLIKNIWFFFFFDCVHLLKILKCHLWNIRLYSKFNPSQLLHFYPLSCFSCFHNTKLFKISLVLLIYIFRSRHWETLLLQQVRTAVLIEEV